MTLFTEDEAKTKWCPLARAPGTMIEPDAGTGHDKRIGVTQNRGYQMGGALSNCMCIASKCMAWQWNPKQPVGEYHPDYTRHAARRQGFCGAFAKVSP